MIRDLAAPMGNGTVQDHHRSAHTGSIQSMLSGRRVGTILLYTMTALAVAVFCSFMFNAMGLDTEFAIAVMGSLIGGFLGALLAAALIVDMYLPKIRQEIRDPD